MPITLSTNAIISLADARRYLNKPTTDVTADDDLKLYINIVTDMIERHLRGPVASRDFANEIQDGSGCETQIVRWKPITALINGVVTDVQYRVGLTDAWQTLEDTYEYIIIDNEKPWQIYLYGNVFPEGIQNIRLQYTAGYTSVPGAITKVALEIVAEMYQESVKGKARLGQSSKSAGFPQGGNATDTYADLFTTRHKGLLYPYVWQLP
jgi:hypothetical protein